MAAGRPLVLRSNDLAVHRSAAAAGLGVAVLPVFAGSGLDRLLPAEAFPREAWLTYHRDLRDSPAIAAVARFLAECVKPR